MLQKYSREREAKYGQKTTEDILQDLQTQVAKEMMKSDDTLDVF